MGAAWFLTTASNGLLGLVVFVVSPWAANVLGPERRGRLAAIQLVPQMLADLAALGLGFSIIHYGSARHSSLRALLRWSFKPMVVGSLVMFAIGQIMVEPILSRSHVDVPLMRVFLLICPVTAVFSVSSEVLRALGDFRRWNVLVLVRGLLWPLSLVVGLSGFLGITLEGVLLTNLACVALLSIVSLRLAWRRTAEGSDEPSTSKRQYVRYGVFSAVSTIPRTANANLDQVIMSFSVARTDLGLYSAAVGWSSMTLPVMRGFSGIAMPHLSGATPEELPRRVRQIVTYSVAAVVVLTAGGLLATRLLWNLRYGVAYHRGFLAALILIPAGLFLELNAILGNVLRSLRRPGLVAIFEAVILAMSTTALFIALQFNAVVGPALVSLGTYSLASVIYCISIGRLMHVPIRSLIQPRLIVVPRRQAH
jgi:O-antigen/teichoic acid export membrane protein